MPAPAKVEQAASLPAATKMVAPYSDKSRKQKAANVKAEYLEGDDGFPTTAPVMGFQPNAFGLFGLEFSFRCVIEVKTK